MSGRFLEWGCRARPLPGERVSGDRAFVNVDGRRALAVAADGLGHGPDAAKASDRVAGTIGDTAPEDVVAVVERCHHALRGTRGAALSVASIDAGAGSLTWLGVGNVEGRLVRSVSHPAHQESLLPAPGVVGHELPPLRAATLPIARGDMLLFATDGVAPAFADAMSLSGPCATIAEAALERHARAGDDALVLVARYLGEGA